MEKATVIGGFGFFGFHLCKILLERGYEVVGIPYGNESASYKEDMMNEIGRNGNFQSMPYESKAEFLEDPGVIVISMYDWLNLDDHKNCLQSLRSIIEKKDWEGPVVLVLPIELAFTEDCIAESESETIMKVYLPTLFGPYQPERYIFQKMILGKTDSPDPNQEYTGDAIYCDDAAEKVIELIERGKAETFVLRSNCKDNWRSCAELLGMSLPESLQSNDIIYERLQIESVVASVSNKEGIARQRRSAIRTICEAWNL
ncbi:hypothetical protein [Bacillus sp. EB01]|uniref:hypothetical protein n=1 Tax=Bacillus sp. EB01 TaxID=1347086 RepID=UPI0006948B5F|nr:hypothetical protein [Bacillus sp. EB01]